jgi:hypothetical protein
MDEIKKIEEILFDKKKILGDGDYLILMKQLTEIYKNIKVCKKKRDVWFYDDDTITCPHCETDFEYTDY